MKPDFQMKCGDEQAEQKAPGERFLDGGGENFHGSQRLVGLEGLSDFETLVPADSLCSAACTSSVRSGADLLIEHERHAGVGVSRAVENEIVALFLGDFCGGRPRFGSATRACPRPSCG